MPEQLVHSEDLHDLHQSYDLPSLAHDLVIFQLLQHHGDEEWKKSNQVNEIHDFEEEFWQDEAKINGTSSTQKQRIFWV